MLTMNSDESLNARDIIQSKTSKEQRKLNSDRGHEEREMDLLERDKSTESLKKLIKTH